MRHRRCDEATSHTLHGLRVVAEENIPTMTMEWEYTPGEALQSEPLQLRVHLMTARVTKTYLQVSLPSCDEDCRMSMPLNLTLTRRPILLRLKGADSGAESAPFQRWQTASDCTEGQYLWTEDSDVLKWKCKTCGDGTLCAPGSLKSDVRARFGWWRSTSDTIDMTQCIFPAACLGNSTRDPALQYHPHWQCRARGKMQRGMGPSADLQGGHRCRLCATCRQGFKRWSWQCRQCLQRQQSPLVEDSSSRPGGLC